MSLRARARALLMRAGAGAAPLALAATRRAVAAGAPLVRVVNFHGTPSRHAEALRAQLRWVSERFRFVTLDDYARQWTANVAEQRPRLLVTFDDGLASNYHVAAPLLEELGARGVFFVPPGFCERAGEDARRFYYLELLSTRALPASPVSPEDWTPMTREQVADLARRGHAIGSHTRSHVRLDTVAPAALEREIGGAAATLRAWTGGPVEAFAWTYAWDAITPAAWRLACEAHALCFSPCPGLVDPRRDSPRLGWRTNVEAHAAPHEYRFLYAGLGDALWRTRRRRLVSLLTNSTNSATVAV